MSTRTKERTKVNYRKIYEEHYGAIPRESNGRSYEIHHIDGNDANNDPSNLTAITITEHYNIHLSQGDYFEAWLIGSKMKISQADLSEITRKLNLKRVEEGTHVFLSGKIQSDSNKKRIADGTFHFLGENNPSHKRVSEGTHNFQKRPDGTSLATDRVDAGTHHLMGPDHNQKMMEDGKHASTIMVSCMYCHEETDKLNFVLWHGDNCKKSPNPPKRKKVGGEFHSSQILTCCIVCKKEIMGTGNLTQHYRAHFKKEKLINTR